MRGEKKLFILMILIWILTRMQAPAWCYIFLVMSAAIKAAKSLYEITKEDDHDY